jgi:hypothetical protein
MEKIIELLRDHDPEAEESAIELSSHLEAAGLGEAAGRLLDELQSFDFSAAEHTAEEIRKSLENREGCNERD